MGLLYENTSGKLRDQYAQLDNINQSTSLLPTQRVVYLIHSINSNNVEMSVIKEHFINQRGGLGIYFEKEASYLKKCLSKGCTILMNISTIDTDQISKMENKIYTKTAQISALKNKSGGGGGRGK